MSNAQSSTTDIDDRAVQVSRGFDRLRVRLEVSLGGNEVHELFGQIDVGALERTTMDRAVAVGSSDADHGFT